MKRFITLITRLFVLFALPLSLSAQENQDYRIRLHAGEFIPERNISSIAKTADVFQQSLFKDRYYIVIQFSSLPDQAKKDQLKAMGVELLEYIPNLAYTASVAADFDAAQLRTFPVRSIFRLTAAQKTIPDILNKIVPGHAIKLAGFADVDIQVYDKMTADKINGPLAELNTVILADMQVFKMFVVRVPIENLAQLVSLPFVQWAEYTSPPNVPENLPGRTQHRANVLNDGVRNLKGEGMNVGVWDEIVSQHLDFSPTGRIVNVNTGTAGSHGTHLTGTIAGRGLINPLARGMAPNATVFSYNGYDGPGGGGHFDNNLAEMAIEIPARNLVASNHSYHDGLGVQCVLGGAASTYTLRARNADLNLNANTFHLHCHSAGNAQGSCPPNGWFTITGTGKVAKNNIVVGALSSLDVIASYSSFGPSNDGRVKPEICAMGSNVFSTYTPLNTYNTISGTSMATPGIAGTLTLLSQRYKELNANVLPSSALIKNITCNTAFDLGNLGPDYRHGFGRVNALKAVRILEQNRYVLNTITTGSTIDITVTVPSGAAKLNVMLTWNDPAGTANSAFPLVNNLDLRVINGATTSLPWVLDPANPGSPATQTDDNISNIEQVTINNPVAGTYTLRVIGEAVTTGPNQSYALTWDIDQPYIEVTYPNGGEAFDPSGSQIITWDNAGVTGNQTVEYSLNNGGSWTTISSSVPASTTRLTWSVPAANTSTALIRVSSGALSDISDLTFKILGTVQGFAGNGTSCTAGDVNFSWSPTTNATHYDIYNLNSSGVFVLLAGSITGTAHTATGLTPGTSMWFTIRARNNTTGAESERANAINVTVSTGGGGIGPVGPITGLSSLCGTPTAVPYSIAPVSGATSYTWTAPPGANIASGQNSVSVTIDYPPGSSNGNVSVFASNGACQTAPSNLAITINIDPNAPTSGGNQTQTVCLPNPLPTLTATATVPAGHTVIWYNAATGGTVVSSPTLNTAGTVTYYAASRNTGSGCESTQRTAVTLTINTVNAASATAGGATTFCQGGSVTLTANSGSSYLWSTGATTQSINASTSGSYTVTVTNGSCTSTSPAITVTVNALPAATITAGGPLSFCQGGNVTLTASAGTSWLWSTGATTQPIVTANAGSYTVTVTNANGCSATSAATNVSVSPNPVVTLSASPYTKLYPGLITTLSASVNPPGSYIYTWFKNNVQVPGASTATLAGIDITDLGSYTVNVINSTGLPCSNTSAALVIGDSAVSKLFILPNPNRGDFDVVYHSPGNNTYTLSIFDSKGALVFRRSYNITSAYQLMDVDMRYHGKGLYHISLTNNSGKRMATGKVVIQ